MGNDGWLWKNKKYYYTNKINKIILPGTHDSGAYKVDWLIGGAKGNVVLNILRIVGIVIPWIRIILNGWTRTQNLSPYNQLKLGIRSLDLRVYYDETTKEFRIAHTLSVMGFKELIKQISKFLSEKANSKEFIILQIKTDYANRKTFNKPKIVTKFYRELNCTYIFSKLWNQKKIPSYFEMVQAKKNIVILTPSKYHSFANKVGVYPLSLNKNYVSNWANTPYIKKSINAQKQFLSNRENVKNKFVDVLGTVTAQNNNIMKSIECMVWSQVAIFGGVLALIKFYIVYDNLKRHNVKMSELFKHKETASFIIAGIVWSVLSLVSLQMFFVRKCHKEFLNILQKAIPINKKILKIAEKHTKKISIITVDFPKDSFVKKVINMNKK